jgi:uncharacterized protein YidB (DUF937 family)
LSSWIGSGENQSVSPEEIKDALGAERLDEVAAKIGLDVDDIADRISSKMPKAIDAPTPDGKDAERGISTSTPDQGIQLTISDGV